MLNSASYQYGDELNGPWSPLVQKDNRTFLKNSIMVATGLGIALFVVLVATSGSSAADVPNMQEVVVHSKHPAKKQTSVESCLQKYCNQAVAAIGMNFADPASGKLLGCLSGVKGDEAKATACLKAAGDSKQVAALALCGECNKCLNGSPRKEDCAAVPSGWGPPSGGAEGAAAGGAGGAAGGAAVNPYWPPQGGSSSGEGDGGYGGFAAKFAGPYWSPPQPGAVMTAPAAQLNSQAPGANPYWPPKGGNPYWPPQGQTAGGAGANPYWPPQAGGGGAGAGANPYWPPQAGGGGAGANPYWPPQAGGSGAEEKKEPKKVKSSNHEKKGKHPSKAE